MYKKIIAFLFSFSIVVSLFSASASAADIYGGGAGRLTDFWSLSYKMWLDGQSDWNPGGIFTAGGGGRDDLASAYSSYVSTLETPSVSSTDLSPYSTTYNMNDFSFCADYDLTSHSDTFFLPGNFPSSVSADYWVYFSPSSYEVDFGFYFNLRRSGYDNLKIDSGVPFSLKIYLFDFYYPDYPAFSSYPWYQKIALQGFVGDGVTDSFLVYSDGSVTTSLKSSISYDYRLGEDSYGKYLTVSGVSACSAYIGVSSFLYMRSLTDTYSGEISTVVSFPAGENFLSFSFGSSGGGSSGSSSLPDESTRLGPVMQSINNYNIDNSYTDNSTTVNYYLTPNNGETLCSPVVFDESTKVFTVPETGQQFLCDYWIYHYTPDNTLTLNGVEFDGNYLGSYILRLADSTYVIGDRVVPAVWVVYMDEKVYVIPYYTDSETGNIVPLDFQPYSYAMVSQSSCSINGHTYTSETTQPPTCVSSGERKYTCSVCGNEYVEDIPATGVHSYQFSVLQEATCTAAGIGLYTCSNCGDQYTEPIAATGHTDHVLEIVPTVYDEEGIVVSLGYTVYECTVCGYQHRVNDDIEADSESLLSGLTGAIKSFSKSIWSAISSSIGKVFSGFTDLIGGIFGFLSDTVLGGVKNFFSSFSDSSILDIFQQENEDGSTTTTLPEGMSGAMATVGGFITGLPSELLGVLVFGIAFLLLLAALKLLL